jgi:hypothetical protein
MKPNLKDEPREWRKSALLALLGLAVISSLLRWRQVIGTQLWLPGLFVLALLAAAATVRPVWFRGYHLLSMRLGLAFSRFLGAVFLTCFFLLILTPVGWLLRLAGRNPLPFKSPAKTDTYWQPARESSPLDRMF